MRLDWCVAEFFRRVHHVCDKNGQFAANVPVLRSRLYAADRRVSDRQVEVWLTMCQSVGLVQLRVHQGLRLGKVLNWDQALKHTKALYPCDEEAQDEIDFAASGIGASATRQATTVEAPDTIPKSRMRVVACDAGPAVTDRPIRSDMKRECVARTRRAPVAPTRTHETDAAWLNRLSGGHPDVNVEAELRHAERYVRQKRGERAKVTRKFFETQWLTGCADAVDVRSATTAATSAKVECEPAPDGWRVVIAESVYGPDGDRAVDRWDQLPAEARQWVRQRLTMEGAA